MESLNCSRVYLGEHTEVALGAMGYSPRDIYVTCLRNQGGVRSYEDKSLEEMHSWLFELINRFVYLDLPRYWSTFDGNPSDLVYTFYSEKMTPKCRFRGKRMYFDGDYDSWLLDPVPYQTLIDRYARTGLVSFEAYVRAAVRNRLGDGPRGGIKGYHADGKMSRIVDLEARSGKDAASLFTGLVSYQPVDISGEDMWNDYALAERLRVRLEELRSLDPFKIGLYVDSYLRMRKGLSSEVISFMDYVFAVSEDGVCLGSNSF